MSAVVFSQMLLPPFNRLPTKWLYCNCIFLMYIRVNSESYSAIFRYFSFLEKACYGGGLIINFIRIQIWYISVLFRFFPLPTMQTKDKFFLTLEVLRWGQFDLSRHFEVFVFIKICMVKLFLVTLFELTQILFIIFLCVCLCVKNYHVLCLLILCI